MDEKFLSLLKKQGLSSHSVHFTVNKNEKEIITSPDTYDKAGTGFRDDFLVSFLPLIRTKWSNFILFVFTIGVMIILILHVL